MSFTMDNVYQLLGILKVSENCAINIDTGEYKISIVKGNAGAPAVPTVATPVASAQTASVSVASAQTAPVQANSVQAAPVQSAPTPAIPASADTEAVAPDDVDEAGLIPVTANVTSVFYRRPSPDEPPFVEVGDEVQPESCVCLLEVMKCFRQVTANVHGHIAKILANNGDLVESGTVMFLIKPL